VTSVDFYLGSTWMARDTAAPFTIAAGSLPAGQYQLTAVATDNLNATTTSAPVSITVNRQMALAFIEVDHLNTPRLIEDSNQQVVWRWDQQEPFGDNVANENPSGLGAFEFPLRFPGQYADKETNLAYNYFRDYDSTVGRYVESDPIGVEGGLNTYAYVDADALLETDSQGLAGENQQRSPPVSNPIVRSIQGGASTTQSGAVFRQLPPPAAGGGCTVCGRQAGAPRAVEKQSGPTFPDLRGHAQRHAGGASVNEYYNAAVRNVQTGRRFNFRHDGQQKVCYLTPVGPDEYLFTSTNSSSSVILTSYTMNSQQLRNIGITLPRGFCFKCQ